MDFVNELVIIGASSGGPKALRTVLSRMPMLDACVLVVQHMPMFINESVRKSLASVTNMDVRIAEEGDRLEGGKVLIAPSEVHMEITGNRSIRLRHGPKVNFVRPSIDVTMLSVSSEPGMLPIAVVLTGIGKDGAAGIRHIKQIGGVTITQDLETSVVYGMPKAAVETGAVDFVLPPEAVGDKIMKLVNRKREVKRGNVCFSG